MAEGATLFSVGWEVSGKVLGVFSCKDTQVEGRQLGVAGWVQSADRGTVPGQLPGPFSEVRPMWEQLETRRSPKSHIYRKEKKQSINNEKIIFKLDCSAFQIVQQWP
ncbi:acylphosphatase-1-like [Eptesicus fuscus]|uniref:acylphosphatase-1-like n=1 Tax=Eptesicus fuscus TaxID=29078 RepID=UPI002403C22D|nr:acylphosphatase-1-like [Eptesicus fuscus]